MTSSAQGIQKRVSDCMDLALNAVERHTTWVVGNLILVFCKTASDHNHWAIFLALKKDFNVEQNLEFWFCIMSWAFYFRVEICWDLKVTIEYCIAKARLKHYASASFTFNEKKKIASVSSTLDRMFQLSWNCWLTYTPWQVQL